MRYILNIGYSSPESLPEELALLFIAFFFGILFIQSGLDKVLNFNDNLTFLKTHFQKTIFSNQTRILFVLLTILELVTGFLFCVGLIGVCLFGFSIQLMNTFFFGMILTSFTICCLFLGQRIANDYVGASNLTIYFLVSLIGLSLFF
tara:strand:+ start:394 stop:834 length:441 start_codon:yes stop_codon:yes gene_type:complete